MTKRVYLFSEGNATMRDLLGGKGANLAEMSNIGLPVPPGFTVTTDVCAEYTTLGTLPAELMSEMRAGVEALEKDLGKTFGGAGDPLLLSVRSGAKVSMPGMMDTILNLGLNPDTAAGLATKSGNERFVHDANRRFIMMFSDVVLDIPKENFEKIFLAHKVRLGVTGDTDVSAEGMKAVCDEFLTYVADRHEGGFPMDPWNQLELAVAAVFKSWNNDRAIFYRNTEGIDHDIGTAVNVQAMVYGNAGDDCGTGVAFTRDPSTGENALYGEYLMNAQGEDVVAGVRTPLPITKLAEENPAIFKQFVDIGHQLEKHYQDMQDLEFTIEHGRLFMLQTRTGKRTGPAAVRMAVEMVSEGLINKDQAIMRLGAAQLDQLLHPRIDPKSAAAEGAIAAGLAASPGAAIGTIVFNSDKAAEAAKAGEKVMLVREETNPDDVHGMLAAQGVLTARGGKTSHAAVVARGFGIPCVAGCDALHIDEAAGTMTIDGVVYNEGDWLTINGSTGEVFAAQLDLIAAEVSGDFETLMSWCDGIRRLGVRANADNPRDARQAIAFGAEGIGLCRTEHMFFEGDRLPIMQDMILTDDEDRRQAAFEKLEVVQEADFKGIFEAMAGKPVTIRLLDPPLHEFLPSHDDLLREVTELKMAVELTKGEALKGLLAEKSALLQTVENMRESNPMLGLRGVRLSVMIPGIVVMQTRAIMKAACKLTKAGVDVRPEIMIPLAGHVNELIRVKGQLQEIAEQVQTEMGVEVPFMIGTMIEIPRAALTSAEIAEEAEFFSFGTNDLTQMTFGYSRDDAETKFLQDYVAQKILPYDPFETIDFDGVGRLMKMSVSEGRKTRPNLKCGICGEHGGDPASVKFCHGIGLDYVSCSPFRVPIARLAAAQAVIEARAEG